MSETYRERMREIERVRVRMREKIGREKQRARKIYTERERALLKRRTERQEQYQSNFATKKPILLCRI